MSTQPDFQYRLTVDASPSEAMQKISQVDQWWAKNFTGEARNLNDTFSVHFGDTFVNFKISEFTPNKSITWLVTDCNLHWINDKKEWNNTEVIWTLSEKNGKTQIDFMHKGVTPASECYDSCEPGWTHHLQDSLLKLIDEGKGLPE